MLLTLTLLALTLFGPGALRAVFLFFCLVSLGGWIGGGAGAATVIALYGLLVALGIVLSALAGYLAWRSR